MKLHKEKEWVVDLRLISVLQSVMWHAKRQATIQVVELILYFNSSESCYLPVHGN